MTARGAATEATRPMTRLERIEAKVKAITAAYRMTPQGEERSALSDKAKSVKRLLEGAQFASASASSRQQLAAFAGALLGEEIKLKNTIVGIFPWAVGCAYTPIEGRNVSGHNYRDGKAAIAVNSSSPRGALLRSDGSTGNSFDQNGSECRLATDEEIKKFFEEAASRQNVEELLSFLV